MDRKDLLKVMYVAYNSNFGDHFAELAGTLADEIHATKKWGRVTCDTRHIAALFKWQCIQLNGEWDMKAIGETFEWVKMYVVIFDLDQTYNEVKAFVEGAPTKRVEFRFKAEVTDSRFSRIEVD